jgi:hypothetical protein
MISVTVDTKQVVSLLGKLENNLSKTGFSKFIKETAAPYVKKITNETFDTAGGRLGGWKPIKESTAQKKGHGGILFEKGKLRQQVTNIKPEITGSEAVWGPDKISGRYRSNSVKNVYIYHQSQAERTAIRKMLAWTDEDQRFLADAFSKHIMKI